MKKTHSNWKTFKIWLAFIKPDRKLIWFAILFSAINSVAYIGGSFLIGYIINAFFEPLAKGALQWENFNALKFWLLLGTLVLIYLIYAAFKYLENLFYVKISFKAAGRVRNNLIAKLLKLPIAYYDHNKTGNLISSLIVDVNNIALSLYQSLTQIIAAFFSISLSILMMSLISVALTLIVVPISLLMFGGIVLLIKKSQPYFIRVQDAFGELNAFVEEMLANTKITNSFNRQALINSELKKITKKIRHIAFKGDMITKSLETIYYVISNSIILVISVISALFYLYNLSVWGVAGLGADIKGKATAALIFTYISLNWNFIGPFQQVLATVFNAQVGVAATTRVIRILNAVEPSKAAEKIRIVKIAYNEQKQQYQETNKKDPFGFAAYKYIDANTQEVTYKSVKGEVVFDNVYFKYNENSKHYQLKGASFKAKQGKVIAIVGPTGAGKTTIINLISKYYDYQKGSIKIDGNELKEINSEDLKDILTIVLQDSFLFNETILANLKMTNPDATTQEIEQATEMTQAHHFIQNMEKGYQTPIENNGMNISQGQRQLLSLSRAILSNRNILILDEATSNIDSSTERIVQKSMLHLMQNRTSFIIAHRLSTIKNADLILVVNDGEIIESGTHQQLLALGGFYNNLYKSQFDE
ncbi:ATP-binding cassette subfamily B protein [Mycoplasmopsis mustelae]|uniref:ATP-binding cassette subfamily B protein n=1 Tax=Mycoplasmopsis mustelae TaxID=171289 RepID=A0A4R7UDT6_9BACT|nr:ABC transporter ATP-binding protein [Mycoplasmopsis mustelae]TDV24081.1 ATP-binding cassette subfamily B protein [Mycoplasmopsis mustelae]